MGLARRRSGVVSAAMENSKIARASASITCKTWGRGKPGTVEMETEIGKGYCPYPNLCVVKDTTYYILSLVSGLGMRLGMDKNMQGQKAQNICSSYAHAAL